MQSGVGSFWRAGIENGSAFQPARRRGNLSSIADAVSNAGGATTSSRVQCSATEFDSLGSAGVGGGVPTQIAHSLRSARPGAAYFAPGYAALSWQAHSLERSATAGATGLAPPCHADSELAPAPNWPLAAQPPPSELAWADVARCAQPGARPVAPLVRARALHASGAPAFRRDQRRPLPPVGVSEIGSAFRAGDAPACARGGVAPWVLAGGARATQSLPPGLASPRKVRSPARKAKARSDAAAAQLGPKPPGGWMPAERPITAKMEEGARRRARSDEPDDEVAVARELYWTVGPVRKACLVLVMSASFQNTVMLAIVASSVLLALDSPFAWWALRYPARLAIVQSFSIAVFFAVLFTLELALRLVALGGSFLFARVHNGVERVCRPVLWNWMDLLVVGFAWVDVLLSVRPVNGASGTGWLLCLRLLRVARPLRTLTFLPSAKTILETVISSLQSLSEAFKLLSFFILFFSVLGSQLFRGDLHNRCVDAEGAVVLGNEQEESTCHASEDLFALFGSTCAAGERCLPVGETPMAGALSFDNVLVALVSVFHAVAGSGFSDPLFALLETNGTPLVLIYFFFVVVGGSLFVVNIFVSVLEQSYESEVQAKKGAEQRRALEEDARAPSPGTPGSPHVQPIATPSSSGRRRFSRRSTSSIPKRSESRVPTALHDNAVDRFFANLLRVITSRVCCGRNGSRKVVPGGASAEDTVPRDFPAQNGAAFSVAELGATAGAGSGWQELRDAQSGDAYYYHVSSGLTCWVPWEERRTANDARDSAARAVYYVHAFTGERREVLPLGVPYVPARFTEAVAEAEVSEGAPASERPPPVQVEGSAEADGELATPVKRALSIGASATHLHSPANRPTPYGARVRSLWKSKRQEELSTFLFMRAVARLTVEHFAFETVVILSIVGSSIVAALEVEPFIDPMLAARLDWADLSFTVVFLLELVLRIFGWGWSMYWAGGFFNRFDFVLVVSSVLESVGTPIIYAMMTAAGSSLDSTRELNTGLLILDSIKAFRCVRLIKVAYKLELRSVKELGAQFPKVIAAVGAIVIVLTIAIFTCAVLMMSAFGGLWADKDGIPAFRQRTRTARLAVELTGKGVWSVCVVR